jgi:hypothetical protein
MLHNQYHPLEKLRQSRMSLVDQLHFDLDEISWSTEWIFNYSELQKYNKGLAVNKLEINNRMDQFFYIAMEIDRLLGNPREGRIMVHTEIVKKAVENIQGVNGIYNIILHI